MEIYFYRISRYLTTDAQKIDKIVCAQFCAFDILKNA